MYLQKEGPQLAAAVLLLLCQRPRALLITCVLVKALLRLWSCLLLQSCSLSRYHMLHVNVSQPRGADARRGCRCEQQHSPGFTWHARTTRLASPGLTGVLTDACNAKRSLICGGMYHRLLVVEL